MRRAHTDNENKGKAKQGRYNLARSRGGKKLRRYVIDDRAAERGYRVNTLPENEGNVSEYNVAKHSSANGRKHTHYYGSKGADAEGDANFRSAGGKNAEAYSVKHVIYIVHGVLVAHVFFLQYFRGGKDRKGCQKAHRYVRPKITEKSRQTVAYHNVAKYTSAKAGYNRKEENAKDVGLLIYSDHRACCGKRYDSDYVKYIKKNIHNCSNM